MSRIVIPGGSGFLGQALAARLVERGDDVVILGRGSGRQVEGARTVVWDAESIGPWANELDGADAVVHLTGRRVDVRGTKRNIDELISSRVQPVRVVGEAIGRCANPPRVWVQSSSLAVFGDGGDTVLDEHSTPTGIGPREMVTVCLAWEGAFRQASAAVERTVLLRMGIGLGGRNDPATAKLAQLVRFGLGGRVGSGRQWVSWVALDDLLTAMILAIDDDTMTGTYHVTSPNPVTNAQDDGDLPASARTADRVAQPRMAGRGRRAAVGQQREPRADGSSGRPHPPVRARLHLRAARLRVSSAARAPGLRAALTDFHSPLGDLLIGSRIGRTSRQWPPPCRWGVRR